MYFAYGMPLSQDVVFSGLKCKAVHADFFLPIKTLKWLFAWEKYCALEYILCV